MDTGQGQLQTKGEVRRRGLQREQCGQQNASGGGVQASSRRAAAGARGNAHMTPCL